MLCCIYNTAQYVRLQVELCVSASPSHAPVMGCTACKPALTPPLCSVHTLCIRQQIALHMFEGCPRCRDRSLSYIYRRRYLAKDRGARCQTSGPCADSSPQACHIGSCKAQAIAPCPKFLLVYPICRYIRGATSSHHRIPTTSKHIRLVG